MMLVFIPFTNKGKLVVCCFGIFFFFSFIGPESDFFLIRSSPGLVHSPIHSTLVDDVLMLTLVLLILEILSRLQEKILDNFLKNMTYILLSKCQDMAQEDVYCKATTINLLATH